MSKSITRLVIQAESTRGREGVNVRFSSFYPPVHRPRERGEGERVNLNGQLP